MPFELLWEPGGVVRRHHGHVTVAERRASLAQICTDPRFDELRFAITDYLDVQRFDTGPEDAAETAALHIAPARTNPNIVIATVATDPAVIAGVRAFIALRYIDQPYEIFPTVAAARAWIARVQPRHAPRVPHQPGG